VGTPFSLCVLLAFLLAAFSTASASHATAIDPGCAAGRGASSGPPSGRSHRGTETLRIALTIDTSDYDGRASYIDSVAFKVSSSLIDAMLIDAPGGASAWREEPGGLSAGGCDGAGGGFHCVRWASHELSGAPGLPDGTYTWVFEIEVPRGKLFENLDRPIVKARYVDSDGGKVGGLVPQDVNIRLVPEPSGATLLGMGALLLGWAGRGRRRHPATGPRRL
jgi:hypothetical protein